MTLTVYLKTPLFVVTDGRSRHAPADATVLTGQQIERGEGGITLHVESWQDGRGRALEAEPATLFLPLSKIDHALVHRS
ncbi:MAG: hypothetical protein H6740_26135 [Alphaproteobacteria bacterium]|nr:hypothetical protein [Alphaproteobacteria bacterium]